MKIFSAAQIRACDAYTIQASGIRSIDLMERAATECADWIMGHFVKETLFVILCGTGNNGGDGLAIARILHQRGYGVKTFLVRFSEELSPDCATNLTRLQQLDNDLVGMVEPDTFLADIPEHIVIVDAILGTGLSRPVEGWLATFLDHVNSLPNRKVAIDIPSGLPADAVPDKDAAILSVNDTVSFQFYKRTFLHPETGVHAGNIHVVPIGLSEAFINATYSQYKTIDAAAIKAIYKPRTPFSHKGTYGHVLMIGGSYGKVGAISLASKAALRAGAGLVTSLVPECAYTILQTSVPEVMCRVNGDKELDNITDWKSASAIGIGPGLGTDDKTAWALYNFLEACKQPIVVDADALNLIARQPELLAKLPKGSVLTPHPKEFSRLFGSHANSLVQVDHARIQAMRYNINIVLKGHHTAVITPEGECWYNMTGNAGMATGGSGDVLTGIITGLAAQGYSTQDACTLGVYLHGLSGDVAAQTLSQEALIAGDITEHLGKAILMVNNLQQVG